MIVPDINLLVYAYNADAPWHDGAKGWWESSLSGTTTVGVPWAVTMGFVRLMTSRSVLLEPMTSEEALGAVRSWLAQPQARVLEPGPRHLDIFAGLAEATGSAGRLTTDLHVAAIAIEHQAELHSNDTDFGRFPGLRWYDPLEQH